MTSEDHTWRLMRQDELVGEIVVDGGDFPWLEGRFVPAPAFAEVKPLFDRVLELRGTTEWDAIYDQIDAIMTLVAPEGPVAEFLLHIKDDRAWFRWIDKPRAEQT